MTTIVIEILKVKGITKPRENRWAAINTPISPWCKPPNMIKARSPNESNNLRVGIQYPINFEPIAMANSTVKKKVFPPISLRFTSIPNTTNKTPKRSEDGKDPNPLVIFFFNQMLDIAIDTPPRDATPTAEKLPKCIAAQAYNEATKRR